MATRVQKPGSRTQKPKAKRKRGKKQCEKGTSCPYKHQHQHTSEFAHDGEGDCDGDSIVSNSGKQQPASFGGSGRTLGSDRGSGRRLKGAEVKTALKSRTIGNSGNGPTFGQGRTLGGGSRSRLLDNIGDIGDGGGRNNGGSSNAPFGRGTKQQVATSTSTGTDPAAIAQVARDQGRAKKQKKQEEHKQPPKLWSCPVCTLMNNHDYLVCGVCCGEKPR
jgi:hypothetical protein